MLKRYVGLLGILCALGCGAASLETASAPLVSSQVYQSAPGTPGAFAGYTYTCSGNTWRVREYVAQSFHNDIASTVLNSDATASEDFSQNEVQIRCLSSDLADQGSYLYNSFARSCNVYAHQAGAGWAFSVAVTISPGNLRYAPIGTFGYPYGYWDVTLNLPSNPSAWGTGYGMGCWGLGGVATVYVF